jgi:hypothetical protein
MSSKNAWGPKVYENLEGASEPEIAKGISIINKITAIKIASRRNDIDSSHMFQILLAGHNEIPREEKAPQHQLQKSINKEVHVKNSDGWLIMSKTQLN